jgi:hypothetical protein
MSTLSVTLFRPIARPVSRRRPVPNSRALFTIAGRRFALSASTPANCWFRCSRPSCSRW